jgi:hypothetical protein
LTQLLLQARSEANGNGENPAKAAARIKMGHTRFQTYLYNSTTKSKPVMDPANTEADILSWLQHEAIAHGWKGVSTTHTSVATPTTNTLATEPLLSVPPNVSTSSAQKATLKGALHQWWWTGIVLCMPNSHAGHARQIVANSI